MFSTADRVAKHLREFRNGAFCDACLREFLDLPSVNGVRAVTSGLALTADFDKKRSQCAVCKREADVIKFHDAAGASTERPTPAAALDRGY